jgi:hypothetical protein
MTDAMAEGTAASGDVSRFVALARASGGRRPPVTLASEPATLGAPGPHRTGASAKRGSAMGRAVVVAFLASLVIPMYFHLGPVRLSPYRLFLLALFAPLTLMWLQGMAGRIRAADLCVLGFALWGAVTFHLSGSGATVQTLGIWVLETMGAYLVGRIMIRDAAAFGAFARTYVLLVALLLPIAIVEALTTRRLLSELFSKLGPVINAVVMEPRLGLDRVQGPFEHPILFGMFCSAALAFAWFLVPARGGAAPRAASSFVVIGSTFLSLSTGSYVSLAMQASAIGWGRFAGFLRRKWNALGMAFGALYVMIDLLSNRTPVLVFIHYLTFNTGSAYNRVLIWQYGTASVSEHPLLGIGFREWDRPWWMHSASTDNFWLLMAIRHGWPGFLLIAAATALVFRTLGRLHPVDPLVARQRNALLTSLFGLCVAICTVHLWGGTFAFFMFLLGCGMWMADAPSHPRGSTISGGGDGRV